MDLSLFANIPQEMRERAQWINWKKTERDGKKPLKMPIDPKTGTAARTNDPATWGTFEEAMNAAPRFSGIGYVFTAADPYTGIDLDDVMDDAGNMIYDDARAIIEAADSYTEISQSGHGIHIIGRCQLQEGEAGRKPAENGKCEKEIYDRGRYFIFTGNVYDEMYYLHDITETAAAIVDEIKADRETATPAAGTPSQATTPPPAYVESMTRDEARAYITGHWREILREWTGTAKRNVNGKESYVCPICGHGKGGDGLTESPRPGILKCFGCDFKGDIIQLWQNAHHVDHNAALKEMAEKCNITIKPYTGDASGASVNGWDIKFSGHELDEAKAQGGSIMQNMTPAAVAKYDAPRDFTGYYEECYRRLNSVKDGAPAMDYLQSRGISLGTAQSLKIGYDNAADPANAPGAKEGAAEKPHPARRLIVPCNKEYYTTRVIDEATVEKQYWKMYPKNEIGRKVSHVFIPEWVYAADYIFICEGIFDALSVVEAGAAAVCLNSTSNVDDLIAAFDARRPAGTCLICLDNDQAGNTAAEKLENGLNLLTIPHARADICLGCKDQNEALMKDRAAFTAAVKAAQETTTTPDGIGAYIESGAYDRDIANIIPPIPTGFNHLDQKSGGGIKTELYVLSAPSSIGKTTFCLHLARRLAEKGRNVLYFAMEQSRLELVNKCIASISCGINMGKAVTADEATKPQEEWQREAVQAARKMLAENVGNRLSIIEWNLEATTDAIKKYILQYIKTNQATEPPIIFIDYLQLIQGIEINGRTQQIREIMSDTIKDLKKLSRARNIPIICIASQARSSYKKAFEMGNVKESGDIEYTAGIVWGLQYTDIEKNIENANYDPNLRELKNQNPRHVTLTSDKNRGTCGFYQVNFDYYPAYDYFIESAKQ